MCKPAQGWCNSSLGPIGISPAVKSQSPSQYHSPRLSCNVASRCTSETISVSTKPQSSLCTHWDSHSTNAYTRYVFFLSNKPNTKRKFAHAYSRTSALGAAAEGQQRAAATKVAAETVCFLSSNPNEAAQVMGVRIAYWLYGLPTQQSSMQTGRHGRRTTRTHMLWPQLRQHKGC